jgi:uncharacterized protein YgiM (DUF1202 family)
MRYRPAILALVCLCFVAPTYGKDQPYTVKISEAYIEMHSGPGRGYPIFHVAERGATLEVHTRRTDWFKVRTDRGIEGWVSAEQLSMTLEMDGSPTKISDPNRDDFIQRQREVGFQLGDFDGANVLSLYAAYLFSDNLSVEASVSDITGDFSSGWMVNASLLHQPFPDWYLSPFFRLGTGILRVEPKATLVQSEDRTDQEAHVGFGFRVHLGRRFLIRAEYTSYVVFTQRDSNEEPDEWKAGFAFFF